MTPLTPAELDKEALGAAYEVFMENRHGSRDTTSERAALSAAILAYEAAKPKGVTEAAKDVLAERHRQVSVEGWTPEHDDEHDTGEMARAAACYALGKPEVHGYRVGAHVTLWPWDWKWWKPKNRRRDLVRAGALILAEIERLDRLTAAKGDGT